MESNRMKELIESILDILPQNTKEIKEDVKDNLKILVNDYLRKIDVVTREEFDVQKEVLVKTRKKLDDLEEKLNKWNLTLIDQSYNQPQALHHHHSMT